MTHILDSSIECFSKSLCTDIIRVIIQKISYFTPSWFPLTIQSVKHQVYFDFPGDVLPNLQEMRNSPVSQNVCHILAAFHQRENDFVVPSIKFLISKYKGLSETDAVFDIPHKSRSLKRPIQNLPSSVPSLTSIGSRRKKRNKRNRFSSRSLLSTLTQQHSSSAPSQPQSSRIPSSIRLVKLCHYLPSSGLPDLPHGPSTQ